MNPKELLALRKQRGKILDDLDPKYILDYLLRNGIIDEDSDRLIRSKSWRRKRATILLDILPSCGPEAFNVFVKSLYNDKNYPWLAEGLEGEINKLNSVASNSYPRMLMRGGVPRLGSNHINRPKEEDEVKRKLAEQFLWNGWVVLHGMMGCGKSTVAAAAVSDVEMLSEYYTAGVFWVSCGMEDGLLLPKMKALCEKLDPSYRNVVFDSIELAKERIRDLFSKEENVMSTLLVLDDVCTDLAVDAFNVGCNTLVTTTDRGLFKDISYVQYVAVSSGFTEEQSLSLLAKYANCNFKQLPTAAVTIHEICKGVPLLISAVGGYISDFPKDNNTWAICVRKLTRKRASTGETRLREDIYQVIDLSLSLLNEKLREYYDTLAVFRDDVYIPREVLATFWNCDVTKVDEIMNTFEKKSLATRIWYDEGQVYLYSIHDLLLDYLKEKNKARIADLHLSLIDVYEKKCGGEWHLLKNDSYIHIAIGYHMHAANMTEKLVEIYFDFKFMKAKIENTMGCADLLYDYQKYFRGITDIAFRQKLGDFIHFIRANSDVLSEKNCDILQLALCQPETSEVYKQVKRLIPTYNLDKFYFDWCNKDNNKGACMTTCNIHTDAVRSATFTPTGLRVISCDNAGIIRIWDCNSVKQISKIDGHDSRIRCCSLCVDHKILVTCSTDQSIKLWTVPTNFFEDQNGNSDDSQNSPPTPYVIKRWSRPLWELEQCDDSKTYYKMTFEDPNHIPFCCAISINGEDVASGGKHGLVFIWSVRRGEVYKQLSGHLDRVVCCQYSPLGNILATGSWDCTVRLWDVMNDYCKMHVLHGIKEPITSCCFSTDGERIFAATNSTVLTWYIESGTMKQLFHDCSQDQILSVAASYEHVAVGTAGYSIIVYSLRKNAVINFYKGHKDWINCVAFSPMGDRLLSASEDKCVKIWDVTDTSASDLKMGHCCDAVINNGDFTTVLVDLNNRVEISNNNKSQVIEFDTKFCVKYCAISNNGRLVAICKDDGFIKVFDIGNISEPILERKVHTGPITCCEFAQNDSFLVTGSEDFSIGIMPLDEDAIDQRLISHTDRITSVKLFQFDEKILSSSYDKTLVVWNVRTQSEVFKCIGHNESVVFSDISSDDRMIISASTDKTAKLWDATSGLLLTTFSNDSLVRSCRFLPDCTHVVTGDEEGKITMWKVTGDYSVDLNMKCNGWVSDLIVSHDSKYLISASKNLRFWDLETGNCLQTFHTKGLSIRKIKASTDFSTVICLDDAKVFYHLSAIQKPRDL